MFKIAIVVLAVVACVLASPAPEPNPQYVYTSNYGYPAAYSYANVVRAAPYTYARLGYPYYNTYPYNSYAYVG
ncbi:unnamed protein product [Chironomus riparius]|uniref:Uncharacterized protein n=1 Tax=Chironomus riparius TaxID=315576 RepID=A0A9N9RG48_9DIPT|nr:unnamed protein product [Chironomus riparius]